MFKERPGSHGGVCCKYTGVHGLFQSITERRGNAVPLEVLVNIQPVEIAGTVHITEANDGVSLNGNEGTVFQK